MNIFQQMTRLSQEKNAINLSQGIPIGLFDDRWQKYINEQKVNNWQYTEIEGKTGLRNAINRLNHSSDNFDMIITSGCTESLLCSMLSFKEQGYKRVITLEPFYSYYPTMAQISNLEFMTSKIILDGNQLSLCFDDIKCKILDSQTIILINSPHNPTGFVMEDDHWAKLHKILIMTNSALIVDEVYRAFNYVGHPTQYDFWAEDKILIANSISKMLAASGIRIGWLKGEKKSIEIAKKFHSCMSNCAPELFQISAEIFLNELFTDVSKDLLLLYRSNRDLLYTSLIENGYNPIKPEGGHFIMVKSDCHRFNSSLEECIYFTIEKGVTPLPLDAFFLDYGAHQYLRFSFSVHSDVLGEACHKLSQ
jgi:aspartate/methionine/tyrosine aminotransferase